MVQESLAAVPVVVGPVPQQIPIGSKGVTVLNEGNVDVTLATDAVPTAANSFTLEPNSTVPLTIGPMWATAASSCQLVVLTGIFNISNPNFVFSGSVTITGPIVVSSITAPVDVTGSTVSVGGSVDVSGSTVDVGTLSSGTVDITGPVQVENVTNTALLTEGDTDYLATFNGTGANFIGGTVTPTKAYSSLIFVYVNAVDPPTRPIGYCVLAYLGTLGPNGVPTRVGAFGQSFFGFTYQCEIGLQIKAGTVVDIQAYMSGNTNGTLSVFGTNATEPPLARGDGYNYPVGSQCLGSGATSGDLLPALGVGFRYHLKAGELTSIGGAAAGGITMNAQIGGQIVLLGSAGSDTSGYGATQLKIPEDGLLLDPNTAVGIGPVGTTPSVSNVSLIYDVVV